MHNINLGGLEFSPSHTVDEHRPKDFKLPDIVIEDSTNAVYQHRSTNVHENNQSTIIVQNLTAIVEDYAPNVVKTALLPSSIVDQESNLSKDMWNEDLWMNVAFKEMHDPKHRHPRHHGKNDLIMPITYIVNEIALLSVISKIKYIITWRNLPDVLVNRLFVGMCHQ